MRARGTLKVLQLIHPIKKRNGTDRASVPSTSFFCGFWPEACIARPLLVLTAYTPLPSEYSMVGGGNGWRKGLRTNSSTKASTSTLLPSIHPPCLQSRPCTLYSSFTLIRYQLK